MYVKISGHKKNGLRMRTVLPDCRSDLVRR